MGLIILFLTFKIYEDGEKEAVIQQQWPIMKMPIVRRVKGIGTLKSPHKIYIQYYGRIYSVHSPRKHFRSTAQLDSLAVHYDPISDRVVPAGIRVTAPYGLLSMLALMGLWLIGHSIYLAMKPVSSNPS
ncbi:hypothetical protein [Larkinella soli]|uniref:hypothetical protein n=1 Tax=Larkinella soli TaxID=1770527 RepID=UPI000FFCABE3|nr:hypothetical protein [Larkinella soli]